MEKFKETKLSSKNVFEGWLLKVRVDTVRLPNGAKSSREVVEHPGAVAIIALTKDQEMVLVRQNRQATGEILLEVPAGVPNKGEAGEEAARRELAEETGFHARKIKKLWEGFASPGYSSELIRYYLALEMTPLKQKTDEDEFIEVDLVDLDLCLDLVKTGKIRDNKTCIGVMLAEKYLGGELD